MADKVAEILQFVGSEFTESDATAALERAGGDVEEAVAMLLEEGSDAGSSSSSSGSSGGEDSDSASEAKDPDTSAADRSKDGTGSDTYDVPACRVHVLPRSSQIGQFLGPDGIPSDASAASALLDRVIASMAISLSQLALEQAQRSGRKVFDFECPSPDDIARDKRLARLKSTNRGRATKPARRRKSPIRRPEREREREVRLEVEADRDRQLRSLGVYDDGDDGLAGGAPAKASRRPLTAKEVKAKFEGIRSRVKNRNSKANRRLKRGGFSKR